MSLAATVAFHHRGSFFTSSFLGVVTVMSEVKLCFCSGRRVCENQGVLCGESSLHQGSNAMTRLAIDGGWTVQITQVSHLQRPVRPVDRQRADFTPTSAFFDVTSADLPQQLPGG